MDYPTVRIDPQLWESFSQIASKRRRKPQTLLNELIREYLEREVDLAWWEETRREYRGRDLSDEEAVDLVHQIRREKKNRA